MPPLTPRETLALLVLLLTLTWGAARGDEPAPTVYRNAPVAFAVAGTTATLTAAQYLALERSWGSVYSNPRHLCPYCLAETGLRMTAHPTHHRDNAEWYEGRGAARPPIRWEVQVYRCSHGHTFQIVTRDHAIWWAPWVDRRKDTDHE